MFIDSGYINGSFSKRLSKNQSVLERTHATAKMFTNNSLCPTKTLVSLTTLQYQAGNCACTCPPQQRHRVAPRPKPYYLMPTIEAAKTDRR